MRVYIVPKEYVEKTSIKCGDFQSWWELPQKTNGDKDYSVCSGYTNATWHQHIYHTAHVGIKARAAKRLRAAIDRGDSFVYSGGPQHANIYKLYEVEHDDCPCCKGGIPINF